MKRLMIRRGDVLHALLLLTASLGYSNILSTSATVKPNNSLLVDVQVTTSANVERVSITYQSPGVDPLVSRLTQVSSTGSTTITIGRLRASQAYTYTVDAFDRDGAPAGTASGSFTTGSLPAPLLTNTYTLTGRTTAPVVIVQDNQVGFRGWVGLDLHSSDAPQIVWYYSNAPSNATGVSQADTVGSIVRERNGSILFGDAGTGGPTSLDTFYRAITPDGTLLAESPPDCSLTPPTASSSPAGWIWGRETIGMNISFPARTVSAARSSTLGGFLRTRSSTRGRLRRASEYRQGASFAAGTRSQEQTRSCGTPSAFSIR